MNRSYLAALATAAFFGLTAFGTAFAADEPRPPPRDPKATEQANQQLAAGYSAARSLMLAGRYEEAITAFKALGFDNHPDVANLIGYSNRKLGRYDDAKIWYERALASDPTHTRTWQYYGLWHLEQGNLLKAKDHLQSILQICGATGCSDYDTLKQAIDTGIISY